MQSQQQQNHSFTNKNYQHFATFKNAYSQRPIKLILILNKYGSQGIKSSIYFNLLKLLTIVSKLNYLLYTFVSSSLTVFALTFLLRTRRAWALSSAGPLRSITHKYLPAWALWSLVQHDQIPKVEADQISADFGQIQNEFWRIYSQHKYDNTLQLLL